MSQVYVPMPSSRVNYSFTGTLPTRAQPCSPISGHGSPEGRVDGNPGQRYDDIDTGDVYVKILSTLKTGWIKEGAATPGQLGGVGNLIPFDGNPNGVVTATGPAAIFGIGSSAGQLWTKSTLGTSNNEWVQLIG